MGNLFAPFVKWGLGLSKTNRGYKINSNSLGKSSTLYYLASFVLLAGAES